MVNASYKGLLNSDDYQFSFSGNIINEGKSIGFLMPHSGYIQQEINKIQEEINKTQQEINEKIDNALCDAPDPVNPQDVATKEYADKILF